MKAIILAAGLGKRMGSLVANMPKCMVKINGKTIVERLLSQLSELGISKIIIVTGPFENMIKSFVKENFPGLNVTYLSNKRFSITNYIYSLWLTKGNIDSDILLLHGDLVVEWPVLKKLVEAKYENAVLVNNAMKVPEKDFKARINRDGTVKEIGVNVFGDNVFFLLPAYKFSKKGFLRWLAEIERFVFKGETKCYAEDAFNVISNELKLYPVYYSTDASMEIDNLEDLKLARARFG